MTRSEKKASEEHPPSPPEKQRFVGTTIDHKRCGVMESYDDDGNLIAKQTLDHGLFHGESLKYDKFNKITEKLTYHTGKLQGPAEFYKNGIPLLQTQFFEGKQEGEAIFYDEAGVVSARVQFTQGLKQGTMIAYDPLGRIRQVLNYVQDVLEGPMSSYYPNGCLMDAGNYVQGQKQGEFRSYYENGVIRQILVFDAGRMIYAPQLFDTNGYPTSHGVES